MGIVNVTPDSFSDGGQFLDPMAGIDHALKLVAEGADILDIGGESTRPGSVAVSEDEELHRVTPVIRGLVRQASVPISVDTSKSRVARECLGLGVSIVNDVTACTGDPQMPLAILESGAGVILMHMQGTPATMHLNPTYENVREDVASYLESRIAALTQFGIGRDQLALDPGIGFGKTLQHNLQLIGGLSRLAQNGLPICLGVSRKGFIGQVTGKGRQDRLAGSLATACYGLVHGIVHIVRVHDVAATRDAVLMIEAIRNTPT
jgi:dihydropteroate synthase